MDLERLAESEEARRAVSQWLSELDAAKPDGPTVVNHLAGEQNLPLDSEGRQAIGRFIEALMAGPGPAGVREAGSCLLDL